MTEMKFNLINEAEGGRKKLGKILIAASAVAILFLVFGNFGGEEKNKQDEKAGFNMESYKAALEEEAEAALSKIRGAGEVKVILSFESLGKTVVARDNQSKTEKNSGEDERESKEINDSVVLYGQGQSEKPYVTEEKVPLPSGVLVIASGADKEAVRYELYEAVKALYGVSSHRIKVTAAKK